MSRIMGKFFSILILICLLGACFGLKPAHAAGSIIVDTNADNTANDGLCTLREAIQAANSNTDVNGADDCDYTGSGDPDSITFAANYTITLLGSQLPVVTTPIIIMGRGAANTVIQADSAPNTVDNRVFEVNSTGNLTLDGVTIQNGRCLLCPTFTDNGGGILNFGGALTVKNSIISANIAGRHGGGIYNEGGALIVMNSTFSDNSAAHTSSIVGDGGGIDNVMGTVSITNSTFSGNNATFGGGISNNSVFFSCADTPSATISNSTFSGNSAIGAGGIFNLQGVITLHFNTITANSGGGVGSTNTGSTCTKAGGNIIFGNTGSDVLAANSATTQRFISLGYNLVGVAGANVDFTQEFNAIGDLTGASHNPMLASLADNGGSTQTHALQTGSFAIDAGSGCPSTDQRGVTRPLGAGCDIGSFEKSSILTSPTFGDVPTSHPYFNDIEILYANGFTGGCSTSPLLFCPETTMDRAQGAVFMLRGLVGTSYVPPVEPFANPFGDSWSPGPWAQRWAQGMLDQGLTAGCSTSPLLYCPWEQMPRAQAAVFGMRLLNGSAYLPPAGTGTVFADVSSSDWYAGWVEQAYANGLLPACGTQGGKPLFCPNSLVSRGLGAYMIVRARNLSMP